MTTTKSFSLTTDLPPLSCGADIPLEPLLLFLFSTKSPADIHAIAASINLPSRCRHDLGVLLAALCQLGILRPHGKKKFLVDHETVREGILSVNPRGFGFVSLKDEKSAKKQQKDIFIPARNLSGALHGDRVLVFIQKYRSHRNRLEGTILATLERTLVQLVGIYSSNKRGGSVTPEDEHFPFQVTIPPKYAAKAEDGDAVVVSLERVKPETQRVKPYETGLTGHIVEILGNPEKLDVQMEMVIKKHGLSKEFPSDALAEAQQLTHEIKITPDRRDLRDIVHVTIDGETARDFDDAVAVLKTDKGYHLYVSIADVSHYVKPGSALDREAYSRGTSIYFPMGVLPMLPERLSNDICSLKPNEDRYTFTCIIHFDQKGRVQKTKFCKSVIRSQHRLTYTLVRKILVDKDPPSRDQYKSLLPSLECMEELAKLLDLNRQKRGSIGLDIPEAFVQLDKKEQKIIDISKAERNQAHKIIEEFMLAANEAVAAICIKKRFPAVYRIHEAPEPGKALELGRLMHSLGFQSRADAGSLQWFQELLRTFQGSPQEYIVNNLTLRVMQQARYSSNNVGHFGLAAESYTHFTSPIRRYPDLMVHRALTRLLQLTEDERQAPVSSISEAADFLSGRERAAVNAERDILDRLKVIFMSDKIGEAFHGIISGVTSFGLFVELQESFINGAIPLIDIPGKSFQVDTENHRIIDRYSKTLYKIGDLVSVKVQNVDRQRWKINFVLSHDE